MNLIGHKELPEAEAGPSLEKDAGSVAVTQPVHRFTLLALLGLLFVVWCVFSPAKDFALLTWDDDINLQANPHLTGLSAKSLHWMFFDLSYQWRYQPLAWLTWFSIFELQGLKPFGYHLINILLHLANTVLLFLVVRKVFLRAGKTGVKAEVGGLMAAGLWSLHPMRVELVAWAVELLYNQALFFLLLAFLAYLRSGDGQQAPLRNRWFWLSFLCLALSLFTFPLAMAFFGVVVVTDIYILKRLPASPREWLAPAYRAIWGEKIVITALCGAVVILNLISRASATKVFGAPTTLAEFGVLPRVMQAFYMWAHYLWRPFWPVDLTPVPTQLMEFDPLSPPFIGSMALVLGITAMLFLYRIRLPWLWCSWLVYLIALVPMLGFTEHPHYPSDRYSLIVSMVLAVLLAALALRCWDGLRSRLLLVGGLSLVSICLAVMSARQLPIWTNNSSFFGFLLVKLKDHPFRYHILTRAALDQRQSGSLKQAEALITEALELRPNSTLQRIWLGDWQMLQGKKEQARQTFITGLNLDPKATGLHVRLGQLLVMEERYAEAAREFTAELQVAQPDFSLEFRCFLALARAGDLERAQKVYNRLQQVYGVGAEENLVCKIAVADGLYAKGNIQEALGLVGEAATEAQRLGAGKLLQETRMRQERWSKQK